MVVKKEQIKRKRGGRVKEGEKEKGKKKIQRNIKETKCWFFDSLFNL